MKERDFPSSEMDQYLPKRIVSNCLPMNIKAICTMRDSRRVAPEVHLPVWTVSTNDSRDEEESPPSYYRFITSQHKNLLPNYFDISIVPQGTVLYYSDLVPYREASQAKVQRKHGDVYSMDPLIDKNPDQLWLYFRTYLNEKPRLLLTIRGQHREVNISVSNSWIISSLFFH